MTNKDLLSKLNNTKVDKSLNPSCLICVSGLQFNTEDIRITVKCIPVPKITPPFFSSAFRLSDSKVYSTIFSKNQVNKEGVQGNG